MTSIRSPPQATTAPGPTGLCAYVGRQVVELLSESALYDHATSALPALRSVLARPHFHGRHWALHRHHKGNVETYTYDPSRGRRGGGATASIVPPLSPLGTASPTASSMSRTASHQSIHLTSTRSMPPMPAPRPMARPTRPPPPPPPPSMTASGCFGTRYQLPDPSADIAFAVVSQCHLDCDLDDAMDVLFNDDPMDFELSMNALWGRGGVKRGDLLYTREVDAVEAPWSPSPPVVAHGAAAGVQPSARLAIKSATLGSRLGFKLAHKLTRGERLCYTTYTQRFPATNEALHVLKTLPHDIHHRIAGDRSHTMLDDDDVDHVAVGYYLTGGRGMGGTKIVVCAYVAAAAARQRAPTHPHPRHSSPFRRWSHGKSSSAGLGHARSLVFQLGEAARGFQRVIRRRRFGNQSFIYFPTDRSSMRAVELSCVVCHRRFGYFRKDHYCQLCGHLMCRKCSRKHEVEPASGRLREHRICYPCVARVDRVGYETQGLWKVVDRPVIVDPDALSPIAGTMEPQSRDHAERPSQRATIPYDPDELLSTRSRSSSRRDHEEIAQDLFSSDPYRRAHALEALTQAVITSSRGSKSGSVTPEWNRSRRSMEPEAIHQYLDEREKASAQGSFAWAEAGSVSVTDGMRLYSLCYPDANPTAAKQPLLRDSAEELIQTLGESTVRIERCPSLDEIASAAARRLQCSMAYITVVLGDDKERVVGLSAPKTELTLTFTNVLSALVPGRSPELPLIVNNPMQDKRLRRLRFLREAGLLFYAEFPISIPTFPSRVSRAALCLADRQMRTILTEQDCIVILDLCAAAKDRVLDLLGERR